MSIFQSSNPLFGLWKSIDDFFNTLMNGFNNICCVLFQFGNIIFFLIFLIMGVNLLVNAKDKEYHERIYAKNVEYIKKKGRVGTIICIFLSVASLLKVFLQFLVWCFNPLPIPLFIDLIKLDKIYYAGTSTHAVLSFDLDNAFLYFLFSLFSFISILLIIFGSYLLFFNKKLLRTKSKPLMTVLGGFVLGCLYGFNTSLRLIV